MKILASHVTAEEGKNCSTEDSVTGRGSVRSAGTSPADILFKDDPGHFQGVEETYAILASDTDTASEEDPTFLYSSSSSSGEEGPPTRRPRTQATPAAIDPLYVINFCEAPGGSKCSPHSYINTCSDLNSELQRVLTGLENVVCGRKKSSCNLSVADVDRHIEQLTTASEHCDLAIKTVEEIEGVLGRELYPNLAEERSRWEKELAGLREENESLTAMLCSKEEDLNRTKSTMNAIREERDRLRRRGI
ncbi:unnamed protein product [Ranitomeya imitator]|uniref:Uncharacterized protein n=1 Tax=Ranitomeya imitator TaxID=111125 RepID=A0ABN9M3S3_9NEOB|nr:unnamed protein product [Ranitomeya imitator]